MPEIAEVARIVHYLRKSLVGKTLASVKAQDDANVFGKAGTSAAEFQKALTGKKVTEANQQGKYFWLLFDTPPHAVFHFGMTGWMHIKGEQTYYYKEPKAVDEEWPPKYWKFTMETTGQGEDKVEVAFTDARRFSRIRLVDCPAEEIRNTTPLKENGPDPVIDKNRFTEEWFEELMNKKKVPVKALLLDQANISGIGNWVGDEIMYHAKIHPEQYSNTFSSAQLKQLHTSIRYVCQTAVDLLADSSKFPDDWLFKHRWGKGKKDKVMALPTGEKITFLTVGGRTSCIVPSLQKKTGAVAGDIKMEENAGLSEDEKSKPGKKTNRKKKAAKSEDDGVDDEEEVEEEDVEEQKPSGRKRKEAPARISKSGTKSVDNSKKAKKEDEFGADRRRSSRVTKKGD